LAIGGRRDLLNSAPKMKEEKKSEKGSGRPARWEKTANTEPIRENTHQKHCVDLKTQRRSFAEFPSWQKGGWESQMQTIKGQKKREKKKSMRPNFG